METDGLQSIPAEDAYSYVFPIGEFMLSCCTLLSTNRFSPCQFYTIPLVCLLSLLYRSTAKDLVTPRYVDHQGRSRSSAGAWRSQVVSRLVIVLRQICSLYVFDSCRASCWGVRWVVKGSRGTRNANPVVLLSLMLPGEKSLKATYD
jgi:hypothetical protein